jgi:RimJ/RimL family protein N-acetyltransferase
MLQTPRLLLRELETDDLDLLAALLGDPQVMRFWPRPLTRDEAAEWIARQRQRYAQDGYGYWLALERESGRAVGQAGLMECALDGASELGLGYIIAREHWRRGFATEAAAACLAHGREALRRRPIALIRPANRPSIGVALKLGLRPGRTTLWAELPHVVYELPADLTSGGAPR